MFSEWLDGFNASSTSLDALTTSNNAEATQVTDAVLSNVDDFKSAFAQAINVGLLSELTGSLTEQAGGALSLENLGSEQGLSQLQASFLTMLQNDLFASSQTNEDIASSGTTADQESTENTVASTSGFISSAYQFVMGEDGATLDDIFDTVNVLNHIPVVSDIYESVTNNDVDLAASLVGGFLYAGPIGVAYEGIDYFVSSSTGASITEHAKNFVMDGLLTDNESDSGELAESLVSTAGEATHSFVTRNLN